MGSIIFKDVNFSYKDTPIIKDLSITLEGAELVVILGRSGAGKTTFLSLLSGLLKPDSGKIENSFHSNPSLVFQSPLLLDYLTLKENILLPLYLTGREKSEEEINSLLKEVEIEEVADHYPLEVSGGESMRASIARALINESPVLILDEPTGQLDENTSIKIYDLLKKIASSHLVILVTHDEKRVSEIADTLYILESGKLNLVFDRREKGAAIEPERQEKNSGKITLKESFFLTKRFLAKKKLRAFLCTFFLAFSLTLLYLGLNLRDTMPVAISSLLSEFYAYETLSISKKTTIATGDNHLTLQRYELLSDAELSRLGIVDSYPSLAYFVPEQEEIYLNNISSAVTITPCLKQEQSRLQEGRISNSSDEVVANQSFLKEFSLSSKEALNRTISINTEKVIRIDGYESSDIYNAEFNFKIVGIAGEKELFNVPTIYYNYQAIYRKLESTYLSELSNERGELTSIISLFSLNDDPSADFTSQKTLIYVSNPLDLYEKLADQESIELSSKVIDVEESSSTIISSLTTILAIFILLALLSALMLEFLSIYSLYDENIRLFAILNIYPNNKANKKRIASGTLLWFLAYTLTFLFVLSAVSVVFVNTITANHNYPAFLSLVDFKAVLIVLVISFIISFIASSLPLNRIKEGDIKKELEGEE